MFYKTRGKGMNNTRRQFVLNTSMLMIVATDYKGGMFEKTSNPRTDQHIVRKENGDNNKEIIYQLYHRFEKLQRRAVA